MKSRSFWLSWTVVLGGTVLALYERIDGDQWMFLALALASTGGLNPRKSSPTE